jgi:UDP-glucose 4-epimerase
MSEKKPNSMATPTPTEPERILLTGGAGFIGSHVAEMLHQAGHDLLVLDDLRSGSEANLPRGIRLERVALESDAAMRAVKTFKPHTIYHFAAQIDIRVSTRRPAYDGQQNIINSLRLLEAGMEAELDYFVFASSGGAIYGEPRNGPQDENHPVQPLSPYGVAKLCVDNYLAAFHHQFGLRTCSMRFANVYGPRQNTRSEAGVVAIWLQRALEGSQLRINGDGLQTRDFIYAGDIAKAALSILHRKPQGVLNLGTGRETSLQDLANLILSILPTANGVEYGPGIPGEQRRSVLDASRAHRTLEWQPSTSLREGIMATAQWLETCFTHS